MSSLEEKIRLYELRHGEAISQVELAGRLDVTRGAISKLEQSEDVRVSTLRQYLEALGARLELVAVFDDLASGSARSGWLFAAVVGYRRPREGRWRRRRRR